VTAFGVARADGLIVAANGIGAGGFPFYRRPLPNGFVVYVEMARPPGGLPIDTRTLSSDPDILPAFQISSSGRLGDGSVAVCDAGPVPLSPLGGVPAIAGGDFASNPRAVNDLACRFDVRTRSGTGPCTRTGTGEDTFVDLASEVQFCGAVGAGLALPGGRTVLTVRGTDVLGRPGPPVSIAIIVAEP